MAPARRKRGRNTRRSRTTSRRSRPQPRQAERAKGSQTAWGRRTAATPGSKTAATKRSRKRGARSAAAAAGRAAPLSVTPLLDLGKIWDTVFPRLPVEFRVPVRRPDDLLVFDLVFENLTLTREGPLRLVRQNPHVAGRLLVEFPPQSFGEQAFLDATGPEVPKKPDVDFKESASGTGLPAQEKRPPQNTFVENAEPVGSPPSARIRMAGRSRLAFSMPADQPDLSYTLAAILKAIRTWDMRLDVNAASEPEGLIPRDRGFVLAFDRAWLTAATRSASWRETKAGVTAALQPSGASDLQPAIAEAGRRIADRAAAALSRRETRGLKDSLVRLMHEEQAALGARFPTLGEGERRAAALGAIALAATESLAQSRASFDFDIGSIAELPFLPIIFSPHEPAPNVTVLELPYRVILSPILPARWLHQDLPVEHAGRTELWHTRLTTSNVDYGPDRRSKVRAIWSPDYPITNFKPLVDPKPLPFRMSLDPLDRKMLVRNMAGFNEKTPDRKVYRPRASRADRLMLSALGALLDAEGTWSPDRPKGVGLEQWRHLAATGRDYYVRVVYAGFLCKLGHAASLIKVTERKFETHGIRRRRAAVLRQRFFIAVREPVKEYDGAGHQFAGRNFPFKTVEILTRVTPNLIPPEQAKMTELSGKPIYGGDVIPRAAFWPMTSPTADFQFEIAATDICGNRVTYSMPLLFVGDEANQNPTVFSNVIAAYNSEKVSRRQASLGSAIVCYAPPKAGSEGDPRLPTATMRFKAAPVTGISLTRPQFYPEVEQAEVGIRAIQRLLGKSDAIVAVTYPDTYKKDEFAKNPGEIFLKTLTPWALEFGDGANQAKSDALGALATPAMAIQGLSRVMGPVAAKPPADPTKIEESLKQIINNSFNPTDFFKDAKILGGIPLASLLDVVPSLAGADVPKMLSRELSAGGGLPARVEASFRWKTEIKKSDPAGLFVPKADPAKITELEMNGVVTTSLDAPQSSSFDATATITNFKINLFGFLIIWFDRLRFRAQRGQKPDVVVDLHPGDETIEFGGPLEFVNQLRKIIPASGFSDPPNLSVTPSGISASYSLNLPSIEIGVFMLSNASLGAGFTLPFDSKPAMVRFNFSERQQPFSLTVSLLGGGGFFAIGVSAEGVKEIEAALEFGAAVAIDLGVASGSVEIKAGVYFHWLQAGDAGSVELAGYVRIHGELSVIGLISVSITFNLQIAYLKQKPESIVWGEATLIVEVEVLCFSVDVSVSCRREFAGGESDPGFIDLIPDQATWKTYCEAFAEEAA